MRAFQYHRPSTLTEAAELLNRYGPEATVLAGGTDLLVRLRKGKKYYPQVIDIKHIHDLEAEIRLDEETLCIGALANMAAVAGHPLVRQHYPALAEAAGLVGSVQIRNRATLAGNICNASPAADTAPALLIYNAQVKIYGTGGERLLPVREFFLAPGRTALQRGEMVIGLELPLPSQPCGSAYQRLTRRRGVDLATLSTACRVDAGGNAVFAFGAVAPTPLLARDDGQWLPVMDTAQRDAQLQALIEHASPINDIRATREYRLAMLKIITLRALESAFQRLSV
jgi:carbon-monoxide dehydrogenase medium subunit